MTLMSQFAARLLFLPIWMVALAILVKGYVDSGDGFSAGVIAALAISLHYVTFGVAATERLWVVRNVSNLAAVGLLIAASVAFVPVLIGKPIMTHWPPANQSAIHIGTLEVISAFAFDIGVFLLVLGFCVGVIDLLAHVSSRRSA
ncbi:hypothetical protein BH23CHL5_BH23CHL5_06800 [soil metagenome]